MINKSTSRPSFPAWIFLIKQRILAMFFLPKLEFVSNSVMTNYIENLYGCSLTRCISKVGGRVEEQLRGLLSAIQFTFLQHSADKLQPWGEHWLLPETRKQVEQASVCL